MKNIIELNAELEKLYNPNIEYIFDYNKFLLNGLWVDEINLSYFKNIEERIKDKVHAIPDLENSLSYKYLEVFYQDHLKKYNFITNIDLDKLVDVIEYLETLPNSNKLASKAPSQSFDIIEYDFESYEWFYRRMLSLYELGDYDDYIGGNSLDEIKDNIDLVMIKKFGYDSFDQKNDLDLNDSNIDKSMIDFINEQDSPPLVKLKECYAYTWLSLRLEMNFEVIKSIANYLEYLLSFIKKFESFGKDELTLEEINESDPKNIKFEFKISKKEIAILFKSLKDINVFHIEKNGYMSEQTQLIKYIDNANMYFTHNGELKPVKGITKEFAKVYGHDERVMNLPIEKKFLKGLVKNLTERIKEIDSEEF
ncbi:hypothetical protein [Winogradskyella helgolandensis]|uniref:hypothetical protein n=1 Tax=Winogradskyella helgolandensis TaxID=2697010 RepID=UPI0015C18D46|nr:hypothetical protein [Winogradskyella helgolandensis]